GPSPRGTGNAAARDPLGSSRSLEPGNELGGDDPHRARAPRRRHRARPTGHRGTRNPRGGLVGRPQRASGLAPFLPRARRREMGGASRRAGPCRGLGALGGPGSRYRTGDFHPSPRPPPRGPAGPRRSAGRARRRSPGRHARRDRRRREARGKASGKIGRTLLPEDEPAGRSRGGPSPPPGGGLRPRGVRGARVRILRIAAEPALARAGGERLAWAWRTVLTGLGYGWRETPAGEECDLAYGAGQAAGAGAV